MAKSANNKYLAVAEREGGEEGKVQICIHGLPKPDALMDGKLEAKDILHRVLHPANRRLDLTGLAFTADGRFLLSLSAMPESTITYWRWEAEKAVSSQDIQLPVTRLQVNPKNSSQLSISGPNYLRLWEYNPNYNQLRDHPSMFPLKLEKQLNIVDHCWVLGTFLCAASEDGHVYVFEEGEQQQDIDVRSVITKDEATGKVAVERAQAKLLQAALNGNREIQEHPVHLVSIAAWGGGFVVGGDQGYMGVFKVDSKSQVEPFGTFRMPHQEGTLWQMSAGSEDTCLAILSYTEREVEEEGQLVMPNASLKNRRRSSVVPLRPGSTGVPNVTAEKEKETEKMWSLSTFPVGQADLAATGQLEVFAPVPALGSHSNHHGAVNGMGVARCRRILVTCGMDQQLKVWGYPTEEMLDQPSPFSADLGLQVSPDGRPKAVAVHPLGFQVAVVTNDMLRIFHLTARQATRTLFDLPLKHPGDVAYSNGGNMLAVTAENDVMLIDPWRSVLIHMFSGRGGHLSAVNQVLFSEDDRLLLSCGAAPHGAIYGWDLESEGKQRALEHVSRGTNYSSMVHDFRRNLVVACMRPEGALRVISGKETSTWREILPDHRAAGYTCMCLAAPLGMFFAGTQLGSVRVFTWPFPSGEHIRPFTDVALHAHSINTLSLSVNAHLLFSACQGGTVMASHVRADGGSVYGGNSLTASQLAERFVQYRFRTDGSSHRAMNREDERKIHDLQRKLTEAGQGFSNQAATMDELLVLPKAYFQECLHDIKELEERANALEHESEYTLEQKEHEISDKLHIIYNERKAERQRAEEKYDAMYHQFKRANARHQEEMKLANRDFESRIRERESQFDGTLSKEYDKQSRLLDELQGTRESNAEQMRQLEQKHEEQLDALRAMQEKTIKEWKGRHDQLCNLLKSDGLKFEEALRQQEQEYEQQITEMLEHKRVALQVESEKSTTALKDGVSMKQALNMLQRQLLEKNKEIEEARKREEGSNKKEAATKEMLAQVKEQLKERERGLKIKDESLAKVREQMKHLESFRFVLFHKVRVLEEERDPLEEQVNSLKSSVREMYSEFVREFRDKQALGRQLQDKSQLSGALQNENVKLGANLSQLKKEGRRLLQDLEKVLHSESTADFEMMPKRLREVLDKYGKLKDWTPPTEDGEAQLQDQADAGRESKLIEEMMIHRDLLCRKNQIAVQSEGQTKRGCSQEVRRLTSENAQLIVEMNTLRNENRSLQRREKELEANVMAWKAKQVAATREAAISQKGMLRVESAPELDPSAGPPRASRRPAPKAAGADTPYVRRKILDQQELYRKQRQKQLSSLPPMNVPDGSEGYPGARKPRSQDARFTHGLERRDAGRSPEADSLATDPSMNSIPEDIVPSGSAVET